ncbi:hypothetical protein [Desulfoluna spongiiphila]|uniref:Uncharacterized protein n=1 Tax=Desulfoluna spongiiphila TaxID=419481 RepID=A0A1G5EKV1_9BACT|nr:hypothetical protein [Desulfoluna spongiiphila]SCY27564.1 hypothetical protein SAMN05216233_10677 [Desulfoluna spongiiphila]VVS91186.1 prokaryotic membrane lipoprotein lipid attachment site profile [Desulfoluna spongiiphila]
MVSKRRVLGVAACLLVLAGCTVPMGPRAEVPFPDALQTRALALESRGDIVGAIRYWEASAAISREKLSALQALRQEQIGAELAAADAALAAGDEAEGIRHLLMVLRMEPGHKGAKGQLRGTLARRLVIPCTVQGGESAADIAGRVYKNVRLDSLVETLYSRDLTEGTLLWLPGVEASLVAAQFSYGRSISRARKDYRAGAWEPLLAVSEEILSYAPGDQEALYLKNTAAHNLAEALFQKGRYGESLVMYRRVDAYYKNEKPRIQEILSIQQQHRDEERLRSNTRKLAEATLLYDTGAFMASRDMLGTVDADFPGKGELLLRLTRALNVKAETHYRKGVRLFLQENLTGAISEWQKSLELNPAHLKAGEGVENAGRLLEKVKGIQPRNGRLTP